MCKLFYTVLLKKSALFNFCFWIFSQNAANQRCFRSHHPHPHPLTEQSNLNEVGIPGAMNHDTISGSGLELEPNVSGVVGFEGGELQSGIRHVERHSVVEQIWTGKAVRQCVNRSNKISSTGAQLQQSYNIKRAFENKSLKFNILFQSLLPLQSR